MRRMRLAITGRHKGDQMEDILNSKGADVKTFHFVIVEDSLRKTICYLCLTFRIEGSFFSFKGVEVDNFIDIYSLDKAEDLLKNKEKVEKYFPSTRLIEAYIKRLTKQPTKKP